MQYNAIIETMSLYEKARFLSGKDVWQTMEYKQYGIPSILLADGPHGLRKQAGAADHLGLNASLPATCFPPAATIGNSWDPALGEEIGKAIGEEAQALGVDMVLGPGLNIKRSPLCGRNFEYFSEDPYLSGKLAAGYIRGIQSQGKAACPKHFAANSQELRRMSSDSIMDDRTFREIYATGFEIAVTEGRPKAIMTSYNRLNGVYTNEDPSLLLDLLREEWGFDGVVVSDWGGSNSHTAGVQSGSHLEMPSTGSAGAMELVEAVQQGRLPEEILDQRVDELLSVVLELAKNQNKYSNHLPVEMEQNHHKLAKKAALESIVMLKNETDILPLSPHAKVAVIGDFAETPRFQGAGSSLVNASIVDNLLTHMRESFSHMIGYAPGYVRTTETDTHLLKSAVELARQAEVVLLCVGLDEVSESEGADRTHMRMPQNQNELIEAVAEVNSNIVLVLSAGSPVEMPWYSKVKGILHGYLCGQAGAGAMRDILIGDACPCGKLNESYPLLLADTPCNNYYPGEGATAEYREAIYVGYRYYETAKIPVRFPFGFGLSYTSFHYHDIKVEDGDVRITIQNTGEIDGAEIVQLYLSKPQSEAFRADKELKGFAKVFLQAGESKEITITLDDKAFRYYNHLTGSWEVEEGVYQILVGASVSDIRLQSEISVSGSGSQIPYEQHKLPAYYSGRVKAISDQEFETLLGHSLPVYNPSKRRVLGENDTISQLCDANSALARFIYKVLNHQKQKSEKKGTPNLNVLFIYNMTFRGIAKMANGMVSMEMVEALLIIVNGHFLRGVANLFGAWRRNRCLQKMDR